MLNVQHETYFYKLQCIIKSDNITTSGILKVL